MTTSKWSSRLLSALLAMVMVVSLVPAAAFAADVRVGKAGISFGSKEAYQVTAKVTVTDGKIQDVAMSHDAAAKGHDSSVSYANDAIAGMKGKFDGISATDRKAILAVDTVSGATMTSEGLQQAVLNALGLDQVDLTFGSANKELQPGTYNVPISLRNCDKHDKPSNAGGAFPAMGQLTVAEDGSAVLEMAMQSVTIGPITDMAYDVKYFKEDNYTSEMYDVTVLETMVKPQPMPGAGKDVPTRISFQIPDNHYDGVYLHFTVDAMGPGYPDAWMKIDYANAQVPGEATTAHGSAKVNQFGKYTIHTDVAVQDGVIAGVDVYADSFISETHRETNEMKIAQVTKALKNTWNGMAPTQENAEKIFKAIMNPQDPDHVIDTVTGATYSAKAVRDAVMDAFKLEYQDEIINVPESVEPGVYEVEIGYYSDVVWHSLVEDVKTTAMLTVNDDKTMSLDFETKSGTEKEPLYILGFNGVYVDNDREGKLTMEGCKTVMGLSSNDYEDEFFAKGTQVVNHLTFPLLGGLHKVYNTNARMYVPAMKALNGNMSGIEFENGIFNADVFAKIYWDTMKKVDEPVDTDKMVGDMAVTMLKDGKDAPSMCDSLFAARADVTVAGADAEIKLYVISPIPSPILQDDGKKGSVTNVMFTYGGKQYAAESDLTTRPMMTAKASNTMFGIKEGQEYTAQILTVRLPKAALEAGKLDVDAHVVAVNKDQSFDMAMSDLKLKAVEPEVPDVPELPETDRQGLLPVTMLKENKDEPSMCDVLFDANAAVELRGDYAVIRMLVANPVPGFPNEGKDGTVTDVTMTFQGKQYVAESLLGSDATMTVKGDNPMLGLHKGDKIPAQVLTFTVPKAILQEKMVPVSAFVNVFMKSTQNFRMQMGEMKWADAVPAPANFTVTVRTDGKPYLTWDAVEGADRYEIERADGEGDFQEFFPPKATSTSLRHGSAKAGETYTYRIRAVVNGVKGAWAESESVQATLAAPEISVTINSDGKPVITWDKVEGAQEYEVIVGVPNASFEHLYGTKTGTRVTHGSAKSSEVYVYAVKAKADGVDGQLSQMVTVGDLAAPKTELATRASDGKPYLTWDKVPGADHYMVYRREGKNGSYKLLKGDVKGTSLRNSSAKPGTTYYYYVVAVSEYGDVSRKSTTRYITCDCARPDVTASLKNGKPYLSWDKVTGAIKYEVYRSVNGGSYKLLTTVKGTHLTNGSAKKGQTCKYRVKAICSNKYGNSALSYIDTVKVK